MKLKEGASLEQQEKVPLYIATLQINHVRNHLFMQKEASKEALKHQRRKSRTLKVNKDCQSLDKGQLQKEVFRQ